jgi:hypothetical protein
MALGVARELLRDRDELLAVRHLGLGALLGLVHRTPIIAQVAANRNLNGSYNLRLMKAKALVAGAVLAAFLLALAFTPPSGPRSMRRFDPVRLASLETRMWQAYYGKERVRLFVLLVTMLRDQYRYSWAAASAEGFHLARAAATFAELTDRYETVLPDLEAAYGRAKRWTGAAFDERAVARAELAWWVARRTRGQDSPEQIGRLIAEEYALLYESTPEAMAAPALLRAQAAALRDAQAASPDWDRIARLLRESYAQLAFTLASANV